jgi:amino acid transporter
MNLTDILRTVVGLGAGALIGYAFGLLQNAALRRNEKRAQSGELKNGWSLMPGSGARIAYLLIALLLVQIICPLIFVGGTQWVVSGGLILGYGWMLFIQLRLRLKAASA